MDEEVKKEKKTKEKKVKYVHELTSSELEAWCIQMRKMGYTIATLQSVATIALAESHDILALSRKIEEICKSFQTYSTVEFIISSDLNKVADRDDYFVYNPDSKKRMVIKPSSLMPLFLPDFMYKKVRHLYDTYNPKTTNVYIREDGKDCFNLYAPPEWYEDHFYGRGKLAPTDIPDVYKEFFLHLVNNDVESYNYLLKWLACSILERNYCYMVTIGQMGIGKGLLYEIVSRLHGKANSGTSAGEVFFSTNFNSDLENKTLFYINEIPKLTEADVNRLKMMVESTIRIERKGRDAREVDNHINLMISSNDLGALPISKDDRRFSIITLTTVSTRARWTNNHQAFVDALKDEGNIAKLGAFLVTNVKYTFDEMISPFKSKEQLREINSMQIEDWEDWFLFQYCRERAGQTIAISEVAAHVKDGFNNSRVRVSTRLLKKLKDKCPGFFVFRATKHADGGEGATGIGIKEVDQQPKRADLNLQIKESED